MDRQFGELLKTRSYADIKAKELPTLQRKVYDVLRDLLPSALDFMLQDHPNLTINQTRVDQGTYYLIGQIMMEIMDDRRLLLTNDDILCCWQRFKELVFLRQAVKQGIIVERPLESGEITYWGVLPKEPVFQPNVGTTIIKVSPSRPSLRVWRRQ